jgi:hypothetical protein
LSRADAPTPAIGCSFGVPSGRRVGGARHRLAHEGVEGLLDPAAEDLVGFAAGGLKLHDIHAVAEALAEQLDRICRRATQVRRVDPDDPGDA